MARRGNPKRRRRLLSRPRTIIGFSPFARFLLFSDSSSAPESAGLDPSSPKSASKSQSQSQASDDGLPRPKPRKLIESNQLSEEEEDFEDEEEEEEQQEFEMVQADFAFFDPKPGDFTGVKLLLHTYLDNKEWDLSGFVDLILEQTTVGTVVKLEGHEEEDAGDGEEDDDDDAGPFAVISALNLGRYAEHKCIKEFQTYLLKLCEDNATKAKLKQLLEECASDIGLLVSQRFVNCPYQLVPPLYDALFDEVSWATEDEPTEELRNFFRFKYYLLLTRIYEKNHANQCKRKLDDQHEDPVIYLKAEDEIFQELSLISFTFRLHSEQLTTRELKNYTEKGLAMVVKAEQVPKFRDKLKELVAES